MGFASLLFIQCEQVHCITSNSVEKSFSINHRMIYAMRNIGQGHAAIKKFSALMNMLSPMTVKYYDSAVKKMTEVEHLRKTNIFAYETRRLNHENHVGSAGVMEVTGAKQI